MPGPKVTIRAVEAKVSKGRLKKYVPVYEEGTVDRDLLVEGARNLRDYFQNQGFYDASVDFRINDKDPNEEIIEYVIARGNRYKLVSLQFRGNKYFKSRRPAGAHVSGSEFAAIPPWPLQRGVPEAG